MKKIISVISLFLVLLSLSATVFAGSVPEDILSSDDALVFFGEVVSYNEGETVDVKPVMKIKGSVELNAAVTYKEPTPCGDIDVKEESVYLFAFYDENNPTYIFETTSYDVKTLKLSGTEHDMWKRMEESLNNGEFTDAENARINKANESLKRTGDKLSIKELMNINPETTETVHLIINGNKKYSVDKDAFFALAEEIVVSDIDNAQIDTEDGLYILINNDYFTPLFISKGCKVEKHSPKFSRPPYADYIMNAEDLNKLYSLLPKDAENILPPLETKTNIGLFVGIGAGALAVILIAVVFVILKKKKKAE